MRTIGLVIGLVLGCSSERSERSNVAPPPVPADAAAKPVDAAAAPSFDAAAPPASPDAAVESSVPDESARAAALVDLVLDKWASAFYMAKGQWRSGSCAKGVKEMNIMLSAGEADRDELAVLLAKPDAVSAERVAMHRNNSRSQNKDRNFQQTFQKSNAFPCPRVFKELDAFVRPLTKAWGKRETPPPWAAPAAP